MIKKALITLFFLAGFFCHAQNFPERTKRLVNDFTGNTLSPEQAAVLERKLVAFADSTSNQIAVVLISSLEGYPIEDYTYQLAEKWGVGTKGKENGILMLAAVQDRKVWITVGYGLEGAVPDALARRIVENELKPNFRKGDYYGGLDEATNVLMKLSSGEFTADQYAKGGKQKQKFPGFLVLIFVAIIAMVLFSKARGVSRYARTNHIPFWVAWGLMSAATSRSHGRWSDFSSGSGSFGGWGGSGGGGGGFGGFGGGSFGGGGAGGSW